MVGQCSDGFGQDKAQMSGWMLQLLFGIFLLDNNSHIQEIPQHPHCWNDPRSHFAPSWCTKGKTANEGVESNPLWSCLYWELP